MPDTPPHTTDATLTSLLGHLPREIRHLIAAADTICSEWATATDQRRQQLWNEVSDAAEAARIGRSDPLGRVIADVIVERGQQDATWGVEDTHDFERISVLTEEVGEAAKAANEANFLSSPTRGDRRNLRAELVQVAAVAVGHVQQIDRCTTTELEPVDA